MNSSDCWELRSQHCIHLSPSSAVVVFQSLTTRCSFIRMMRELLPRPMILAWQSGCL